MSERGRGARDHMWVGGEGGLLEQLELEKAKLHSYPKPLTTETSARTIPPYALPNPHPTPRASSQEPWLAAPPTVPCPAPESLGRATGKSLYQAEEPLESRQNQRSRRSLTEAARRD